MVALDIYPKLLVHTLDFLRCSPSTESINNAILKWDVVELKEAAAAEGLVLAKVRTNRNFVASVSTAKSSRKCRSSPSRRLARANPFRSKRAAIFLSQVSAHWEWVT